MKTLGALLAAGLLLATVPAPSAARAAEVDPAAAQIEALDAGLLDVMRHAHALGADGRFRKLQPIVERAYDIATMTRFAVGPGWAGLPAAQQQALIEAFERLTVASYAHHFTGYSGEQFQVDQNVFSRGPDKVVSTRLIAPGAAPILLAYRMREIGGAWKIIDVLYNGAISQLTTRRADFAATLAHGGAPALAAHLNQLADNQLR